MYGTKPGMYLLAPESWQGDVPVENAGVFTFDTRMAVCAPRVFMDDTNEDRAAIQPVLNQIMMYPLSEFTGDMKSFDWSQSPHFPGGNATQGEPETQWVDPSKFFDELSGVMDEVPARPGEEAIYDWSGTLVNAAANYQHLASILKSAAIETDSGPIADLFQFRYIGIPISGNWSTQCNGAMFGNDYLSRTAMAKANIFVNTPSETTYFYQDLDEHGDDALCLGRAKDVRTTNWLPTPSGSFCLYLRAYWPEGSISRRELVAPTGDENLKVPPTQQGHLGTRRQSLKSTATSNVPSGTPNAAAIALRASRGTSSRPTTILRTSGTPSTVMTQTSPSQAARTMSMYRFHPADIRQTVA
jgi:hypothetical protein